MRKKSRLNCEMIWKIRDMTKMEETQVESEKICKIWKKGQLNSEMI